MHAECRPFDPDQVHQKNKEALAPLVRGPVLKTAGPVNSRTGGSNPPASSIMRQ